MSLLMMLVGGSLGSADLSALSDTEHPRPDQLSQNTGAVTLSTPIPDVLLYSPKRIPQLIDLTNYFSNIAGDSTIKVGVKDTDHIEGILQICAESSDCSAPPIGTSPPTSQNDFDGADISYQEYGGTLNQGDRNFWITLHSSNDGTRRDTRTIRVEIANTNKSAVTDEFTVQPTESFWANTVKPVAEPIKGDLTQALLIFSQPLIYQPDTNGVITTSASTLKFPNLPANSHISWGTSLDTTPQTLPIPSVPLTVEEQYLVPFHHTFQPISLIDVRVNTPISQNGIRFEGQSLRYKYSTPTGLDTAIVNDDQIKLSWVDNYVSPINTTEKSHTYRIGPYDHPGEPTSSPNYQLQTEWTTQDWITACETDIGTETIDNTEYQTLTLTGTGKHTTNDCGPDTTQGLPDGQYRIQLRRHDDSANGIVTRQYITENLVEIAIRPAQPTNLQTQTTTSQTITLTWNPIPDRGNTLTQTQIRHKPTTTPDWTGIGWQNTPNPTQTTHTITGLTNNQTYNIQLRAQNTHGHGPTAQTTTIPQAPPPGSTTPTTTGNTQPTTPEPTNPTVTNPPTNPTTPQTQPNPPGGISPQPPTNNQPPTRQTPTDQTPTTPTGFTDTSESVHETNIIQLAEMGVTRGCNPPTNDRFCPDRSVIRGEMATFLVRAFELAPTDQNPFTDTQENVHQNNINRMAAAGISRGCNPPTNNRFCPNRAVTRAEMATFMTRVLQLEQEGTGFDDTGGNVHATNIRRFAEAGITRGCNPPSNTRYCPDRAVTRAEMATFLVRSTSLNNS